MKLFALGAWAVAIAWFAWALAWSRVVAIPPSLIKQLGVPGGLLFVSLVLLIVARVRPLLALTCALLVGVPSLLLPAFVTARIQGKFRACQSNLKNLATALEIYHGDQKNYPPKLDALVQADILKTIPVCGGEDEDEAPLDSYSASYSLKPDGKGFYLYCQGNRHPTLLGRPDHPRTDESGEITY